MICKRRCFGNYILCCTAALIMLLVSSELAAKTFYTMVGSGASYRNAILEEPPYNAAFVSPILEGGIRTRGHDLIGFHIRFVLDPEDTSHVSSYFLSGKTIFFIVPRTLYVGGSVGLHIEREYSEERENDGDSTIGAEEAHGLFNAAFHAGCVLKLFSGYSLVFDVFASQSIGRYLPWSLNATVGILTFF